MLDDVSVLIVTGNVDGGILQLLFDGGTGCEDDFAGGDESRTYVFYFRHRGGLEAMCIRERP